MRNYTSSFVSTELFKIGEEDGVLRTSQIRSSYKADFYLVRVRAASKLNDSLSRSIDLEINIDKESDSFFPTHLYQLTVEENRPPNEVLLELEPKLALDERRMLRYKLNPLLSTKPEMDWFELDYETGVLRTNSSGGIGSDHRAQHLIDCEQLDELVLSVDVFDIGNENRQEILVESLLIKVSITDLNDNSPVFDRSLDEFRPAMSEDDRSTAATERFVTRLKATDLDRTERNAAVGYEIVGVRNGELAWFRLEVNGNDGSASLFKVSGVELDREKTGLVFVRVRAFDLNEPSVFAEKEVEITLLDLNDNAPAIANSKLEISLDEEYPLYKVFLFFFVFLLI